MEEKIKFWVEISQTTNAALIEDAKKSRRSRKAQLEYILQEKYDLLPQPHESALETADSAQVPTAA